MQSLKSEIIEILAAAYTSDEDEAPRFLDIVNAELKTFFVLEGADVAKENILFPISGFTLNPGGCGIEVVSLLKVRDGSFILSLDNGDEYLIIKGL